MPVRNTMADLITRTRRLIADPAGDNQVFEDQEIQDALDEHRFVEHLTALKPEPTLSAGATSYLVYQAVWGDWEADVVLQNGAYVTLSPDTSDYIAGRWTFATSTYPPVFATGKTYDRYAAAASLLEQWAAKKKFCVTTSVGNKRFDLNRQFAAAQELADSYRLRARPVTARQVRDDLPDDRDQLRDDTGVTRLLSDLRTQYY